MVLGAGSSDKVDGEEEVIPDRLNTCLLLVAVDG